MTSSVTDVVLSPTVTSVYFLTAENWDKHQHKDLSNFVSGEAMASSVPFWLRYWHCYLQNWYPTFSFNIVLSVITTITVLLRLATHD